MNGMYTYFYIDGSAGHTTSGFGIFSPTLSLKIAKPVPEIMSSTEIEMRALDFLLDLIQKENLKYIKIYSDCKHVEREFQTQEKYNEIISNRKIKIKWIPREENEIADTLAGEARRSLIPTKQQIDTLTTKKIAAAIKEKNIFEIKNILYKIASGDLELALLDYLFEKRDDKKFFKKLKTSPFANLVSSLISGKNRKTLSRGNYLSCFSNKISENECAHLMLSRNFPI